MAEVSQFLVDGVPHVVCQGCDSVVNAHTQTTVPDEGIKITLKGWYGGFTDEFPDPPATLVLCHSCALGVFRAIPALAGLRGLHSTVSDDPCCEFQWTFGRDEDGKINRVIHGDGTERMLPERS